MDRFRYHILWNKGYSNDVNSDIFDAVYYYKNTDDSNYFEKNINMNDLVIKGIKEGSEDGNAVNLRQLNQYITALRTTLENQLKKVTTKKVIMICGLIHL